MGNGAPPLFRLVVFLIVACTVMLAACRTSRRWQNTLEVTATAFNSIPSQTQGDPTLTAWGVRLEPGMRVIAVSRDLIREGLTNGVEVKIEGLPGSYVVADKLHRRYVQRIDIYMGDDVEAALEWGRRRVTIYW